MQRNGTRVAQAAFRVSVPTRIVWGELDVFNDPAETSRLLIEFFGAP